MISTFWRGKRVLVTGHTGFKGSWLVVALSELEAEVSGYALPPEGAECVFSAASVSARLKHDIRGDIRDLAAISEAIAKVKPEIIFHLAAQPLVRFSYAEPVYTFDVNVMGTANMLQAARFAPELKAFVAVTSDKCYENVNQLWGYRETDAMGGHDPYSASKGAAEIVISAMRRSFFSTPSSAALASVRAGNVIGGGDWSHDRLVPDIIRAFSKGVPVTIRSPQAVRPWQHVMDPVLAYIHLAERMVEGGRDFATDWNIGPGPEGEIDVETLVKGLAELWSQGSSWQIETGERPHEAAFLSLDCSKARKVLGYTPTIPLSLALKLTVAWYKSFLDGQDMAEVTRKQISTLLECRYGTYNQSRIEEYE